MLPTETKQLLAGPASYNIRNSLRFRASASAQLTRTPSSASNRKTWTWSGWVKRGLLATTQGVFCSVGAATDTGSFYFTFYSTDQIRITGQATVFLLTTQVFRDPSSWYHIVLAMDTTNATADNRLRLYVNGSEVTAFATRNNLTLNTDYGINQASVAHYLMSYNTGYCDGYLAEVNFIDGSALTPSSFGFYDPYTGVWMPQRYTGTYTGNSFYLPFINQPSSTFAATFNGSTQYLTTNAFAASTNLSLSNSDFTVEYWMNTTTATNGTTLCCAGSGTASFDGLFGYIAGGGLQLYLSSTGGSWDIASARIVISAITTGRWYHIAYTRSGSTWRVFVDGTQVDTFTSSASLYQSANQFTLGRAQSTGYFTGLLSNVRVVKGTALYTSNFLPSIQPLTAVTNTQLLTLQNSTIIDNSANNIPITNTGSVAMSAATPFTQPDLTADYSGLGNNWTPNNISLTAGVTYDSMIDVPTNWPDGGNGRGNYCVLNFLDKYSTNVLSNANLSTNGLGLARTTFGMSSGKWYWEAIAQSTACINGVVTANANIAQYVGQNAFGWGYYGSNGNKYNNGTNSAYGATYTTNDVIGVAFDADNGTLVFYKNGVSQGTAYTGLTSGPYFASCSDNGATAQAMSYNFGQRPFSYTPPSGFLPLNSNNLPAPTIPNGAKVMAATLYTGDGSASRSISNQTNSGANFNQVPMKPDLVWFKSRNNAISHRVFDVLRNNSDTLVTNSANAESTGWTNDFQGYNNDGFTVGTGTGLNLNTNTYTMVAWQWNAGSGTTSSGTGTGGITNVTQSVNVSAGFSIVRYTGSGTAGATFTHGLGVTPGFLIIKDRTSANDWRVWHSSFASTTQGYLTLNATDAVTTSATIWNSTAPNSSVITVGTSVSVNANTDNYICYAWAPIAGYSSMGSYTGNGSADGPFIYTGFRPRWVMIKKTSAVDDWVILDTSRNIYNVVTNWLFPNLSSAELTAATSPDVLSNGFKLRSTSGATNASGATFIYAAFAENPFKVSRAR